MKCKDCMHLTAQGDGDNRYHHCAVHDFPTALTYTCPSFEEKPAINSKKTRVAKPKNCDLRLPFDMYFDKLPVNITLHKDNTQMMIVYNDIFFILPVPTTLFELVYDLKRCGIPFKVKDFKVSIPEVPVYQGESNGEAK